MKEKIAGRRSFQQKFRRFVSKENGDSDFFKAEPRQSCSRSGDWICTLCNNFNYSFRSVCNRCSIQSKQQNYRIITEKNLFEEGNMTKDTLPVDNSFQWFKKDNNENYKNSFLTEPDSIQSAPSSRKESYNFPISVDDQEEEYPFEKEVMSWIGESREEKDTNDDVDNFSIESTKRTLSFLNFD